MSQHRDPIVDAPPRRTEAPAARQVAPPARDLVIRDAVGNELVAGCALLGRALGFAERDALPPWLVQTATGCGAIALGAFAGARLAGFSFALLAADGELFSCGLAVTPAFRDRGVGRAVKLAQRDRALAQGCTRIRWTADPLAAAPLSLYLSGLGARLVAYEPELYAVVRPAAVPPDDVLIEWPLSLTRAAGAPAARVEIPYDHRSLDRDTLLARRLEVRQGMTDALGSGAVGTGVAVERAARRAWVLFSS
jgi:predicted GNAT superfamily acetyltransferase